MHAEGGGGRRPASPSSSFHPSIVVVVAVVVVVVFDVELARVHRIDDRRIAHRIGHTIGVSRTWHVVLVVVVVVVARCDHRVVGRIVEWHRPDVVSLVDIVRWNERRPRDNGPNPRGIGVGRDMHGDRAYLVVEAAIDNARPRASSVYRGILRESTRGEGSHDRRPRGTGGECHAQDRRFKPRGYARGISGRVR